MRSVVRRRHVTSWLVAALALCVALVPAQGTAVCFGADGHVDIGPAGSCPCDDEGALRELPTGDVPGLDDHAPCRDLVVATAELTDADPPRVDVERRDVDAPPTVASAAARTRCVAARPTPRPAPTPPPPMRGVALLI